MKYTLPTDSTVRKGIPMKGGCRDYFPAALMGVARWSKKGNDQHNPGQPLHWSRGKSSDHEECIERHSMDLADIQAAIDRLPPGVPQEQRDELIQAALDELDARAWRSLAASQEFREKYCGAPLAPGARAAVTVELGPLVTIRNESGLRVGSRINSYFGPDRVERAGQEWDAHAAEKRAETAAVAHQRDAHAGGTAQKPTDATERVIEERRVEAMKRRLIDTELAVDASPVRDDAVYPNARDAGGDARDRSIRDDFGM